MYATIMDADNPGEGYFYINSNPTATDITFDKKDANNKVVEHSYTINKNLLVKGTNTIRFTHVATAGYDINALKIKLSFPSF